MARSENVTGAFLMMASMASFTFNDTLLKIVLKDLPLFQTLFLRGSYTILFAAFLAWRMQAFGTWPPKKDIWLIILRMAGEAGAAYFFLSALYHMPLANVTSIMQATPLIITLGAALLFGEPIGWRRMLAIVIGFAGVMLIVRPGADDFTVWSVYALIAVFCVAVRDLSTRRLSKSTPSMLVTFTTAWAVTLFAGVMSVAEPWVAMTGRDHLLVMATAVLVMGGYVFSIMVMRVGDVAFTSPFRYTALLWALMLGWIVFDDWPRPITLVGAVIVVGSGLFMLYREAQLGLARRRTARLVR